MTELLSAGALWVLLAALTPGCGPGPGPAAAPQPRAATDGAGVAASGPNPSAPPDAGAGPTLRPRAAGTSTTALLAAARALDARDPTAALAALDRAAPDPTLDAYRALLAAEAHLALRDPASAQRELVDAAAAPALHTEIGRLRAEALATTDVVAAARILLALPPEPSDLARAADFLARARTAEATTLRRTTQDTLLTAFPESPEATVLTATLTPAAVIARLGPQSIERVEHLLDSHQNERARDEARALLAVAPLARSHACRARYAESKALRKMRQYKGALVALPLAAKACATDTGRLRATQLLEIQVRGIRGEAKTIRARTEALLKADPQHRYGDDALLLLAQAEEKDAATRADARLTYQRIIDTFPTGDQAGAAAWGLAFDAIQREAWKEAEPLLQAAIAASWVEPVDRARARYWLARTHAALKRDDVCTRFTEAALADGLGFFTWLTLGHLDRTDKACATTVRAALIDGLGSGPPAPPPSAAITGSAPYARAIALAAQAPEVLRDPAALRLRAWAAAELATLTPAPEDRITLALAYDAVGAHKPAQDILRAPQTGVLDKAPTAATLVAWSAAYSRPFRVEIEAAAGAEELDPLLLTALSREESTFDPAIVSWAGATGLAQLMPGTAITAHLAVYKKKLDLARLTEPAINLRLGAWVLDDGLDKFGQVVPLALGAYNGGPGLVLKALPSAETPYDLWSETVSVRETRRYMQRVVGTWGIYRFLYAPAEQRFIALPETIAAHY